MQAARDEQTAAIREDQAASAECRDLHAGKPAGERSRRRRVPPQPTGRHSGGLGATPARPAGRRSSTRRVQDNKRVGSRETYGARKPWAWQPKGRRVEMARCWTSFPTNRFRSMQVLETIQQDAWVRFKVHADGRHRPPMRRSDQCESLKSARHRQAVDARQMGRASYRE